MWLKRLGTVAALSGIVLLHGVARAAGNAPCGRAVVVTLAGVTWQDVSTFGPPHILEAARDGAVGAMSVRTITVLTTPADAFASLSAGARVQGGVPARAAMPETTRAVTGRALVQKHLTLSSLHTLDHLATSAGYDARPGSLAASLGNRPLIAVGNADLGAPPPSAAGLGRWALLAAMDPLGHIEVSSTGPRLLTNDRSAPYGVKTDPSAIDAAIDRALSPVCASVIVDPGDLDRADVFAGAHANPSSAARRTALAAADAVVGHIEARLRPRDLLMIVTTTSPSWADAPHLGVAIADGPAYPAGTSLVSASTRRAPNVTLPDIAPTLLDFQGMPVAGAMDGRPMTAVPAVASDRIEGVIALDKESAYVDSLKGKIDAGYISFQIVVYLLASVLLILGGRRQISYLDKTTGRVLSVASLSLAAFPAAVYLGGIFSAHAVGALVYSLLLTGFDALLVAAACMAAGRWLDRLLLLSLFTIGLIFVNLLLGAPLELNTVFGYSPIVAGRFAGLGNTGFAILGGAVIVAASLAAHRWRASYASVFIVALFALAIVFDGAPQLGSDVGGIVAFVPALGVTVFLLLGIRPRPSLIVGVLAAAALVLAVFLAIDLARPAQDQTHLARLYEAVKARGFGELSTTVARKFSANFKIFKTTFFTYLFPPALAALAFLLLRPRGRWRRLANEYPKIRAGLIGGIVLGALGAAVNDSGIIIPAMMLSFFVPLAFLVHLEIERKDDRNLVVVEG